MKRSNFLEEKRDCSFCNLDVVFSVLVEVGPADRDHGDGDGEKKKPEDGKPSAPESSILLRVRS